jgi:hypothetical protein
VTYIRPSCHPSSLYAVSRPAGACKVPHRTLINCSGPARALRHRPDGHWHRESFQRPLVKQMQRQTAAALAASRSPRASLSGSCTRQEECDTTLERTTVDRCRSQCDMHNAVPIAHRIETGALDVMTAVVTIIRAVAVIVENLNF